MPSYGRTADGVRRTVPGPVASCYDVLVRLSARNQLAATVTEVHAGAVTTTVKVRLEGGATMTSSITKEAADELGLAAGKSVIVVVKASDVMLAVE
jgi:molybdate transport system regulatory protein